MWFHLMQSNKIIHQWISKVQTSRRLEKQGVRECGRALESCVRIIRPQGPVFFWSKTAAAASGRIFPGVRPQKKCGRTCGRKKTTYRWGICAYII